MKTILPVGFFNSLMVLTRDTRFNLWQRMAYELLLQRDRDEKIIFIKEEIKRIIESIITISDGVLITMFTTFEENEVKIDSFGKQYADFLCQGYFLLPHDRRQYNALFKTFKIENNSVIAKRFGLFSHEEILDRKNEILELPRMKTFLDTWTNLMHLDVLYENKEALANNLPIGRFIDEASSVKKTIKDFFKKMSNNKGWEYAFKSKNDFDAYCDLLTLFFEANESYEIPTKTIKLKPNTKTQVAMTLGEIYGEYEENMRGNKEFYKLIKVLSPFENSTEVEIYNALKR